MKTYIAGGPPSAADLGKLPGLGPRFAAVLSASARFLYPAYLDEAADADLCAALTRFYEAVVDPPLHADAQGRHIGVVRHGLNCLLHGRDPLPVRFEACVAAPGTYHVAGLGPVFWSALFQAACNERRDDRDGRLRSSPRVRPAGLAPRLRQAADEPGFVYAALLTEYQNIPDARPHDDGSYALTHFLTLVGSMRRLSGDLWQSAGDPRPIAAAVQQGARRRLPLRAQLQKNKALRWNEHGSGWRRDWRKTTAPRSSRLWPTPTPSPKPMSASWAGAWRDADVVGGRDCGKRMIRIRY